MGPPLRRRDHPGLVAHDPRGAQRPPGDDAGMKSADECRAYVQKHHEEMAGRAKERGRRCPAAARRVRRPEALKSLTRLWSAAGGGRCPPHRRGVAGAAVAGRMSHSRNDPRRCGRGAQGHPDRLRAWPSLPSRLTICRRRRDGVANAFGRRPAARRRHDRRRPGGGQRPLHRPPATSRATRRRAADVAGDDDRADAVASVATIDIALRSARDDLVTWDLARMRVGGSRRLEVLANAAGPGRSG